MAGRGRRKRLSGGRTRQNRPASPTPSDHSQSASELAESSSAPSLFNTTFSTYRVSPLYLGAQPLTRQRLQVLAQRLRDLVVGDVVRGIEVGLEGDDTTMPRAGALELVDISWVTLAAILGLNPDSAGRPPSRDLSSDVVELSDNLWDGATREWIVRRAGRRKVLHISLRYENTLCTAMLLPPLDGDGGQADIAGGPLDSESFLVLPLLLVRMPAPLRPVIIDFLSTTFDCRVSPLRLGTRSLVTSLERWMATDGSLARDTPAKDVVLSLGFAMPITETRGPETDEAKQVELGLRSVDVIISASELDGFHSTGGELTGHTVSAVGSKRKPSWEEDLTKRRKLAGRLYEEGWEWRRAQADGGVEAIEQPFLEALGRYFDAHLALNLFDPRVKVTRIACGGFVMSEGRVKIFPPGEKGSDMDQPGPAVDLLEVLIGKAMGRAPEGVATVRAV